MPDFELPDLPSLPLFANFNQMPDLRIFAKFCSVSMCRFNFLGLFCAIFVFSCLVDYFQFDSIVLKVSTLDIASETSQRDKINLIPIFSFRRGQIELSRRLEMKNWKTLEEVNLMKWQIMGMNRFQVNCNQVPSITVGCLLKN